MGIVRQLNFSTAAGISSGVQAAATIVGTIAGVSSAADRRKYQEAFALFSEDQKILLATQIEAAKNQTEKLNILANAYYQHTISQRSNAFKLETAQYILIGGIAVVLILIGVVYSRATK